MMDIVDAKAKDGRHVVLEVEHELLKDVLATLIEQGFETFVVR